MKGFNVLFKSLDQIDSVRGTEFQEIFIVINEKKWQHFQEGKLGAGSLEWSRILSLHTMLTRSKDATIIFVEDGTL